MRVTERFAIWCKMAETAPDFAAGAFLREASALAAETLIHASLWRDEDVADFERRKRNLSCSGPWGSFWITSTPDTVGHPQVTPRGIVALARAVRARLGGEGYGKEVCQKGAGIPGEIFQTVA